MKRQWTPEEAAALDTAFAAGVREAMTHGQSLLMQLSHVPLDGAEYPVWIALYPPAHITAEDVAAWCAQSAIRPTEGDLFFPREHVLRAARDLGILQ